MGVCIISLGVWRRVRCVVLPEVWRARAAQEVAGVGIPGVERLEGVSFGASAVHAHLKLDFSAAAGLPEDVRPVHAAVIRIIVLHSRKR